MEKQSFLLYLGVGFLMTLGVWGLMGGCSSEEKNLVIEEPLLPQPEPVAVKREEIPVLPPKPVDSQSEASLPISEPVKMVEEQRTLQHVVQKGDTLWLISRQYNVVIENIMKWNNLDSMNVWIGQKLKIKTKVLVQVEQPQQKPAPIAKPKSVAEAKPAPENVIVKKEIPPQEVAQIEVAKAEAPKVEVVKKEEAKGPKMATFKGELLTHEVKNGDSLKSIASNYETTIAFLKDINGLTDKSQLHAGQILLVPEK